MFYNTENFFDCDDDSLTNDDEFTRQGLRGWSYSKLKAKADRLSKVIVAAGKWNNPILIGLCEVENRQVLDLLVRTETLKHSNYKIVQKESPDPRGIDVALLYRPDFFRPFSYKTIQVVDPENKSFRTREILQVSGVMGGCDTIHVFVNHWPSRYGGVMETLRLRKLAALALKNEIGVLRQRWPEAKIVCMGDFNDSPTDISIAEVLGAVRPAKIGATPYLINLSAAWLSDEVQTIKSKYRWDVFDQFIVSGSFMSENQCYSFTGAEIFKAGFLLEPDLVYGGFKPRRTYIGYKYNNGFSDHLPIMLRLKLLTH